MTDLIVDRKNEEWDEDANERSSVLIQKLEVSGESKFLLMSICC